MDLSTNETNMYYQAHSLVKRSWDSVIPKRPILAKVMIAGTCFIFIAVVAGALIFIYVYLKYHKEYLHLQRKMMSKIRKFKPSFKDLKEKPKALLKRHKDEVVKMEEGTALNEDSEAEEHKDDGNGEQHEEEEEVTEAPAGNEEEVEENVKTKKEIFDTPRMLKGTTKETMDENNDYKEKPDTKQSKRSEQKEPEKPGKAEQEIKEKKVSTKSPKTPVASAKGATTKVPSAKVPCAKEKVKSIKVQPKMEKPKLQKLPQKTIKAKKVQKAKSKKGKKAKK